MRFDWEYYPDVATSLCYEIVEGERNETLTQMEEAKLRATNHAAYYAMFHFAKNFILTTKISVPRHNVHQFVINFFTNGTKPVQRSIGKDLRRLRDIRNQADYDNEVDDLLDKTLESIVLVNKIIPSLYQLKKAK